MKKIVKFEFSIYDVRLAAGRCTQAGDASDQWRDQWRRRLKCVVQQADTLNI